MAHVEIAQIGPEASEIVLDKGFFRINKRYRISNILLSSILSKTGNDMVKLDKGTVSAYIRAFIDSQDERIFLDFFSRSGMSMKISFKTGSWRGNLYGGEVHDREVAVPFKILNEIFKTIFRPRINVESIEIRSLSKVSRLDSGFLNVLEKAA